MAEPTEVKTTNNGDDRDSCYDVIIIGAGISGLTCGDQLVVLKPNLKVAILEGSARVGGRTKTIDMEYGDGEDDAEVKRMMRIDAGGMWLGPTQTEMLKLCERFNIKTVQQHYTEGTHVTTRGKERKNLRTFKGDIPPHSIISLLEIQFHVIWRIDSLMAYIDLDAPETCPYAKEWDAHSVASFLGTRLWTKASRDLVELCSETLLGSSASQVSMLYFLYMCKANDGLKMLIDTIGGAQDRKMIGGAQQISENLGQSFEAGGGKLFFDSKVVSVEVSTGAYPVVIRCRNGKELRAKACVSAGCASKFIQTCDFKPSLPRPVRRFAECTFRGAYAKAIIAYKTAWWRELGFSGFATNSAATVDACAGLAFDYGIEPPALVFFITGHVAEKACELDEHERKESVLNSADLFYPGKHPRDQVIGYHDEFWQTNEFVSGAPMTVYPPGTFQHYSAHSLLRKPFALSSDAQKRCLLFFAGTDVSNRWIGYMEGAYIRGKEVALEITARVDFSNNKDTIGTIPDGKDDPPLHWVAS